MTGNVTGNVTGDAAVLAPGDWDKGSCEGKAAAGTWQQSHIDLLFVNVVENAK